MLDILVGGISWSDSLECSAGLGKKQYQFLMFF